MRYVAFLRAINVGKHNRIRMDALRSLCSSCGLENVSTYLQTGNVLFDSDLPELDLAATIEATLFEHGLRNVIAAIRTAPELRSLLETDAFAAHPMPAFGQMVTLFRDRLPAEAQALVRESPAVVAVTGREICAAIDRSQPARQDINGVLEKRFKLQGTTRYWHVVEATAELLTPPLHRNGERVGG